MGAAEDGSQPSVSLSKGDILGNIKQPERIGRQETDERLIPLQIRAGTGGPPPAYGGATGTGGKTMAHSFRSLVVHLVFSPKNRMPVLRGNETLLERCIRRVLLDLGCLVLAISVLPDHVHVGLLLTVNYSVAEVVRKVKLMSGRLLRSRGNNMTEFSWQEGYGAFSWSYTAKDRLVAYIVNQPLQHTNQSFQEEIKDLLLDHGLERENNL